MIRHAFIAALKGLKKNKVNLVINLIGMTLGIGAVFVIAAFVISECSIGKELNEKNIYRIEIESKVGNFPNSTYSTAKYLSENLPSVINASVFRKDVVKGKYNNQQFACNQAIFSDASFFEINNNIVTNGRLADYKTTTNAVVLTKSVSDRIFGDKDPIGKTIEILQYGKATMNVVAVVEDMPNAHINEFDMVANISSLLSKNEKKEWGSFNYNCLVELENGTCPDDIAIYLNNKVKEVNSYVVDELSFKAKLVAYQDIYFDAPVLYDPFKQGNKMFVVFFMSIAVFMLIIAIINSVNLTRAQWLNRMNEIGVRKSVGASSRSLFSQFIGETIILNLGSFILAISIIMYVLKHIPKLNSLQVLFYTPQFISAMLLSFIIIGATVGLIASRRIINTKITKGLKGESFNSQKAFSNKMALISFQFIISIVMITTIIGINKQIYFITNKDIGFQKENLVDFNIHNFKKHNLLRNKIIEHPSIDKVAFSFGVIEPRLNRETVEFKHDGKSSIETPPSMNADLHFADIMNFDIIEGRLFEKHDKNNTCLINQEAAKTYNIENLNKELYINGKQVIGIIKNYNFASLHQKIEPLVIFGLDTSGKRRASFNKCVVKINSSDPVIIKDALVHINTSWKELSKGPDAQIRFIDDIINIMYAKETNFKKVLNAFTLLIILIVIMGLFGVSLNIVSKRTKEIGIRKVNGATTTEILLMLNKDFIKWVAIAFVIAVPLAYYAMSKWMENFAYKTELSWWIFALAGVLALGIALLTVSFQSWKAARRNPIESLRYE